MSSTKTLARIAGALYLIVAVAGGFSQLFVRSKVSVPGDAAATAANIVQNAALFRVGFITDLVAFVCFLAVGFVLYVILKPVSPNLALAMLLLNAVSVALSAANMINQLGALLIATDPGYTAGLTSEAAHSLVLWLVEVQRQGYLIAQIFFGLYLLPLGYLVYRSHFFPRVLGAVLMAGCAGYLAGVVAVYAAPGLTSSVSTDFGMVGGVAELLFLLWLLVKGADSPVKEQPSGVTSIKGELTWKA